MSFQYSERQYSAGIPVYHIPPTHTRDRNYPEFYTQGPNAQPTFEGYKGQHGPAHFGVLRFTEPYSRPQVLTPATYHRDDRSSRPHPHVYPTLPTHVSDGRHLRYAPVYRETSAYDREQMYPYPSTAAYQAAPTHLREQRQVPYITANLTPPTFNRDYNGMQTHSYNVPPTSNGSENFMQVHKPEVYIRGQTSYRPEPLLNRPYHSNVTDYQYRPSYSAAYNRNASSVGNPVDARLRIDSMSRPQTKPFEFKHRIEEPHTFDGTSYEELSGYLIQFELIAEICGWNDSQKAYYLLNKLRGDAMNIVNTLTYKQCSEYKEWKQILIQGFQSLKTEGQFQDLFFRCTQNELETPRSYAQRLQHIYSKAFPRTGSTQVHNDLKKQFIKGLRSDGLRQYVQIKKPSFLDEAVKIIETYLLDLLDKENKAAKLNFQNATVLQNTDNALAKLYSTQNRTELHDSQSESELSDKEQVDEPDSCESLLSNSENGSKSQIIETKSDDSLLSNCEIESKSEIIESEIIESESDLSANEIGSESCIRGNKPVQHGVKTEISKSSHILENAQHGCLAAEINSTIRDTDLIQSQPLTEISDPKDVHSHEQIPFAQNYNMIPENCNVREIEALRSDISEREIIVDSVICDITYSNDHLYLDRLFPEQARNCIPVKELGLISRPEIQPRKIQKGHPVRQMISMTQFKDQISNMNKIS